MNGSVGLRQFLSQHQDGTVRQAVPGLPTPRGVDPHRVSAMQAQRAQMSVASRAINAADCALLLSMLGLLPEDDGVPPVLT
jgi:hypothetical protein